MAVSRCGDLRGDSLKVVLRGLFLLTFLPQSLLFGIILAVCMSTSFSSSLCKTGTHGKTVAILSPPHPTLAGTPQWSGIAPTGLANPQRVSQSLKPVLVHCLGGGTWVL